MTSDTRGDPPGDLAGLADGHVGGRRPSAGLADWGSFEAKRGRKLVCGADATPAERLAWLEEALRIAWQTGALPRRPETSNR